MNTKSVMKNRADGRTEGACRKSERKLAERTKKLLRALPTAKT